MTEDERNILIDILNVMDSLSEALPEVEYNIKSEIRVITERLIELPND